MGKTMLMTSRIVRPQSYTQSNRSKKITLLRLEGYSLQRNHGVSESNYLMFEEKHGPESSQLYMKDTESLAEFLAHCKQLCDQAEGCGGFVLNCPKSPKILNVSSGCIWVFFKAKGCTPIEREAYFGQHWYQKQQQPQE
uniref:Uncharacterized protein n=1 Tax=Lotharella oceanica TaxID=641309 RepID=A0A7S2U5N8_9EUKA|mmetsp:Transcript_8667/g.17010  ORF Transcript_8667/g.17010 Transcript_8667/m.17010 type:complete len:139 (+) Transcript_8667:323-739(+)